MYVNPENELERLLRLAVTDSAYWPEFDRALLAADVLVLGRANLEGDPNATSGESEIELRNWTRSDGTTVIPFFTSTAAVALAAQENDTWLPQAGESYLRLPVRMLFTAVPQTELHLNPLLDYGRAFRPDEIDTLLRTGYSIELESRLTEQETQVKVGKPQVWPGDLVDAVAQWCARQPQVKAAWLAMMHDPSVDTQPRLLLGLDTDVDDRRFLREVGEVASAFTQRYGPIDIIRVGTGNEGLAPYFRHEDTPFYTRSLARTLKSMFGRRRS